MIQETRNSTPRPLIPPPQPTPTPTKSRRVHTIKLFPMAQLDQILCIGRKTPKKKERNQEWKKGRCLQSPLTKRHNFYHKYPFCYNPLTPLKNTPLTPISLHLHHCLKRTTNKKHNVLCITVFFFFFSCLPVYVGLSWSEFSFFSPQYTLYLLPPPTQTPPLCVSFLFFLYYPSFFILTLFVLYYCSIFSFHTSPLFLFLFFLSYAAIPLSWFGLISPKILSFL